jgi:hypothetical protein
MDVSEAGRSPSSHDSLMKSLAHEIIIAVQSLLGKIARSPYTPEKFRKAAETVFFKLNQLRFKIGS